MDTALNLLKDVEVDAIVGPQKSAQANFVMDLGDKAHVPIISFPATNPSLLPPTPYFVQTAQSDDTQVGAIVDIIKTFQWRSVIIIHEDTDYGNGIVPYLVNHFEDFDVRVRYRCIVPLLATEDFVLKELYKMMMTMETRVFVVHISHSLGALMFLKAKEIGMMSEGYAWIVTSGFMDLLYSMDFHVLEAMQVVLGVKPRVPKSKKLDSFVVRWKRTFLHNNPSIKQAEISTFGLWAYDTLWALAMAAQRVGLREPNTFVNESTNNSTNLFSFGTSQTGPELPKAMMETRFDDGLAAQGIGNPSNWEEAEDWGASEKGFTEFVVVERNNQIDATKVTGYCIDVFDTVIQALPYAVPYEYVPFAKPDGSSNGSYNDLVHQVFIQNFDATVGDITIAANRSSYVDFTLPYAEGGISMVVRITYEDMDDKWTFFKPLKRDLWLASIAFFILTGFSVWVLEHRINTAFKGERLVSNLTRLVVVVWVFVMLTFSSSYIASLSSRLTAQRLRPAIKDVKELIENGHNVGCQEGSFIVDRLKGIGFE
ncbi:unnamed protein product [Ilex paraguariensis]|uniref:Ionotropic glutamate receptor C-terminal domain-containing protein n=1 Tax=Ilex paraguariensis TaxID=185542 RepID=A0ABC8RSS9_9AQUA